MKKRTALRTVVVVVLIGAAAVSVLAFTYRNNRATRALPVETWTVKPEPLIETVSGTGTFVPEVSSTVFPRVSGIVDTVYVEAGDRVSPGAPLVRLELSDFSRAVRQAESALSAAERSVLQGIASLRAAYRNAKTAADQAQRNLDKTMELWKIQAVSEEVLNQAQDALESANVNLRSSREQLNLRLGISPEADSDLAGLSDLKVAALSPEVSQAAVALETAKANFERASITAPVAGTVTEVVPDKGDIVSPSAPVAKVESLDRMRADVQIDEVDIGKISVGSPAEITSDSLLGETLNGTVTNIAPVISQVGSTRVSLVKIVIDAGGRELKAGASCTARITTRTRESVTAIPLTGFLTRGNQSYAYVLHGDGRTKDGGAEDGGAEDDGTPASGTGAANGTAGITPRDAEGLYRLEEREIETGISTISRIEVVSGLEPGDLIAVGDLDVLRDGMRVTPRAKEDGAK